MSEEHNSIAYKRLRVNIQFTHCRSPRESRVSIHGTFDMKKRQKQKENKKKEIP
jgi:hypothetical protein